MKSPGAYRAPYADRLAGIARAAKILGPKVDDYVALDASCRALAAVVKVEADAMTTALLADVGRIVAAIAKSDAPLAAAVADDATTALNRLAGMIRSNDPDPKGTP